MVRDACIPRYIHFLRPGWITKTLRLITDQPPIFLKIWCCLQPIICNFKALGTQIQTLALATFVMA